MTNLRAEWTADIAAAQNSSRVMATVTATPGNGTVTVRLPDAVTATITIPKLSDYSPTVGDSVAVVTWGKSWLALGVPGDYAAIPVVSSLPTASATYRGITVRTAGATGVADAVYVCTKSASDTYSWVRVDNVAGTTYGVLGTATSTSHSITTSATTVLTATVSTSGTGYIKITFTLGLHEALSGGGGRLRMTLKDGSSTLATFDQTFYFLGPDVNALDWYTWTWVTTATAGSHTYSVTVQDQSSSTGTVGSGGQITVESVAAP